MARSIFFKQKESPTEQENNLADKIGGHRSARSGAYRRSGGGHGGNGNKGDVFNREFEIECKMTDKKSMTIKKEWLERASAGARPKGKKPALHLLFNTIDPLCANKWILIEEDVFLEMINRE